jgi:hypothetical protein
MTLLIGLGDGIIPDTDDPALAVLFEKTAGVWVDITTDLISGSIKRGRQRELDQYDAGRSTVLLKNDQRQYDPNYASGTHYGSIKPMKRLWVLASWAGITYSLFFGYIDRWVQNKVGPDFGTTTVTATDAFKVLNKAKLFSGSLSAGQLTGTHVNDVLDLLSWPDALRDVDAGTTTLQAHAFDGESALSHLQLIASSEFGDLYMNNAGLVRFESRTNKIDSSSQATFSYDGGGGLGFVTTAPELADDEIINDVLFSRVGGTEETASDATSIAAYQRISYGKTDFLYEDDDISAAAATYFVNTYKDPVERVDTMEINPYAAPTTLFPQVLGRELTDRITLIELLQGVGSSNTKVLRIEGIAHSFQAKEWKTTFNLSRADSDTYLQLDNPDVTIEGSNPGRIYF